MTKTSPSEEQAHAISKPVSQMGEHTPGPWRVAPASAYQNSSEINIDTADRGQTGFIATVGIRGDAQAEADAEFIVRACNAHDELLAALLDLVGHAQWVAGEFGVHYAHLDSARTAIAIAKATGER